MFTVIIPRGDFLLSFEYIFSNILTFYKVYYLCKTLNHCFVKRNHTAFCVKQKALTGVGGERPDTRPLQLSKLDNGFNLGPKKKKNPAASLVVQWLRLCTSNAESPGSCPGQGTRSHMLQLDLIQTNKHFFFKLGRFGMYFGIRIDRTHWRVECKE